MVCMKDKTKRGFLILNCVCGAILRYKKSQTHNLNSFCSDCDNCGPLIISRRNCKGAFHVEKANKFLNRNCEIKRNWGFITM